MTDDGRDEDETPDNTTTDDEDYHTDEKKIRKQSRSCTSRERRLRRRRRAPTTPTTSRRTTRLRPTPRNSTGKKKAVTTPTATPPSTAGHKDEPEDQLEPWSDFTVRATHKADDLWAAGGITSWILRQSRATRKQARLTGRHHEGRGTKLDPNWNRGASSKQKRWIGNKEDRPRDGEDDLNMYLQPDRSNRYNNDLTSDMIWLTTVEDSLKCDAMGSDFRSSRLKQPARPPSPRLRQSNQERTTKQQVRQGSRPKRRRY